MDELFGDELDGLDESDCHDEFDDLLTKLLYQNQKWAICIHVLLES